MIIDSQNRTFKTLRISLTGMCNLGCMYCVSNNEKNPLYKKNILSVESLIDVTTHLHHILNLKTIRLTGGEPTLYPDLVKLIEGLTPLGVEIKMTTNAYHLDRLISPLYEAGLKNVNISLDAYSEKTFQTVSNRKGLSSILRNIELCKAKGYQIKINTVVVNDINDHEILEIFDYAHRLNIPIRFLELMKMGHLFSGDFEKYYYSQQKILTLIKSKYSYSKDLRVPHATANYFSLDDGYKFGIIANESAPFCTDCDRLRLDVSGNIYGCLSNNTPLNISNNYSEEKTLESILLQALSHKQSTYFQGSDLSMTAIGG